MRMRGLTRLMKQAFFPAYRASGGGDESRRVDGAGRARGARVDRELSAIAAARRKANAPNTHVRTRQVLRTLRDRGFQPLASQVAVRSPDDGVATAADLLCRYAPGTEQRGSPFPKRPKRVRECDAPAVVVEVKIGFSGYASVGGRYMRAPFQGRTDSPANQHQIQLALTVHMLELACRKRIPQAYVVRAEKSGVYVIPLADWARRAAPDALRRLQRLAAASSVARPRRPPRAAVDAFGRRVRPSA